jgi:hypothetical protein
LVDEFAPRSGGEVGIASAEHADDVVLPCADAPLGDICTVVTRWDKFVVDVVCVKEFGEFPGQDIVHPEDPGMTLLPGIELYELFVRVDKAGRSTQRDVSVVFGRCLRTVSASMPGRVMNPRSSARMNTSGTGEPNVR